MLSSITIKRYSHWIYRCEASQKKEMLTKLISDYADKSILIATSNKDNISLEDVKDVTLMSDDEIRLLDGQPYDMVIHADLPIKASHYIKRLSSVKELSIGLFVPEESQLLYQIERVLGKTIPQKYLEGFEPMESVKKESPKHEQKPYREKKHFDKKADTMKRRQRNHHKDGTVRSDEERAEYQVRRSKIGDKKKAENDKNASDEKSAKKSFVDKKRKPFDKNVKKNDFNKSKKNDHSPENKYTKPKREPRTFKIKASKKDGDK